jgi:flagellum-specific peptidoglycan hydrolase FlgJ
MTAQEIDQLIYNTALDNGYSNEAAKLITAQARLESADYTSNVFKQNNNMYGMKFVGQSYATKGTLAPYQERSAKCKSNFICVNSDYYAKYQTPADSIKDTIIRLYSKNIQGIIPGQLKAAKTAKEFAELLKQRGYFGITAAAYEKGLTAKLKKIQVKEIETLPGVTVESKKKAV